MILLVRSLTIKIVRSLGRTPCHLILKKSIWNTNRWSSILATRTRTNGYKLHNFNYHRTGAVPILSFHALYHPSLNLLMWWRFPKSHQCSFIWILTHIRYIIHQCLLFQHWTAGINAPQIQLMLVGLNRSSNAPFYSACLAHFGTALVGYAILNTQWCLLAWVCACYTGRSTLGHDQ